MNFGSKQLTICIAAQGDPVRCCFAFRVDRSRSEKGPSSRDPGNNGGEEGDWARKNIVGKWWMFNEKIFGNGDVGRE